MAVGLLLVVVLAVGVFYFVGYESARSLTLGNVTGRMNYRTGLLGYAEFDLGVPVSSGGVLDTTISQVTFSLTIDSNFLFGSVQAQESMLSPGQSLQYTLRFTSSDPSVLQYLSQGGSHQVTISMNAMSSAGIYSGLVTVSTTSNWSWNSSS